MRPLIALLIFPCLSASAAAAAPFDVRLGARDDRTAPPPSQSASDAWAKSGLERPAYDGVPYGAQPAPPPRRLTRAYVEMRAGYDRTMNEGGTETIEGDGNLWGMALGVDRIFGRTFLGGYGGITYADTIESTIATGPLDPVTGTFVETAAEATSDRDVEIGGRVGRQIRSNIMGYVFAALTNVARDDNVTISTVTPADPAVDGSVETRSITSTRRDDLSLDGIRLGIGLEIDLVENGYAKIEYRYSDYGDLPSGAEYSRHQGLGALGIRF